MFIEGTKSETLRGNMSLTLAEAKRLVADLSRAIDETADHRSSHPVQVLSSDLKTTNVTIWVCPFPSTAAKSPETDQPSPTNSEDRPS